MRTKFTCLTATAFCAAALFTATFALADGPAQMAIESAYQGATPSTLREIEKSFDWDKFQSTPRRLLHIGQYLRNFQTFFDLKLDGWSKQLRVLCFFGSQWL